MKILFVYCLIFLNEVSKGQANRPITHEDIRDAILSTIHVFRDTSEKLERHELRERQLGDQLKKALSSLDKRERAQDHVLSGITSKLNAIDDRLKKIESSVQTRGEVDENIYTVDTVPLKSWMSNVELMLSKQTSTNELQASRDKLDAMETAYKSKMDYIATLLDKLHSEMSTLSSRLYASFEEQQEQNLIELKKWHSSIASQMDLLINLPQMQSKTTSIDKDSITEEIRTVKDDIINIVGTSLNKITNKLTDIDYSLNSENLVDAISKNREMMNDYFHKVEKKIENLSNDVNAVENVEKILIKTDENVLDSKRKIEFMKFQILKGVEETIAGQSKDLNETVNDKFIKLFNTIEDNQNLSITNISGKIETEMGQVWRQIGILYTQLIQSAGVLEDLQNQTHIYVNQSNDKMDKMDARIDSINNRVADIHENLNYFMGRLSLVTQEFNHTRNALAKVVDNLKIDLDKPKEDEVDTNEYGPGPIPISESDQHNLDNNRV